MSVIESLHRYSIIIEKLRRFPASWEAIDNKLRSESKTYGSNLQVSKRTFDRYRHDILSLYGLDIIYDISSRQYSISPLSLPGLKDNLLEAFDTLNALNFSEGLNGRLHFEKRRPRGTNYLMGILHALQASVKVKFLYHKFWADLPDQRLVDPLALKEYRSRWYLIALDNKDGKIKSFALDRLSGLEITAKVYRPEQPFDIEKHFEHCFGIMSPNEGGHEEIILSFNSFQGKYIKSLPLHASQVILIDTVDELKVTLDIYITVDFIMELLSYGANVKIIKPVRLIQELNATYKAAATQYVFVGE